MLFQGTAQQVGELDAVQQLFAEFRPVQRVLITPFTLGHVHRGIGVTQQLASLVAMLGSQGDADAGRGRKHVAGQLHRFVERLDQLVGDQHHLVVAVQLQQHDEFVAAPARHQISLAQGTHQARGDLLQQRIADVVAEGIVDLLEVVQVDEQQRQAAIVMLMLQGALQALLELQTIGQLGQHVETRQMAQMIGRPPPLADIAQRQHQMPRLTVTGAHQGAAQLDRDALAIAPLADQLTLPVIGGEQVIPGTLLIGIAQQALQLEIRQLAGADADQFEKGRIGLQRVSVTGQHHVGITVVGEGGGQQAQMLLGLMLATDVLAGAGDAPCQAIRIALHGTALGAKPQPALLGLATHAKFQIVILAAPAAVLLPGLQRVAPVIRVQAGDPVRPEQHLLERHARLAGEVVQAHQVVLGMPLPDQLAAAPERQLQPALVLRRGQRLLQVDGGLVQLPRFIGQQPLGRLARLPFTVQTALPECFAQGREISKRVMLSPSRAGRSTR